MYVAIRLECINLGNERTIFKPIGIIKGIYEQTDNIFIDEYTNEYEIMEEYDPYNNNYFCYPILLRDLKKNYPKDTNEYEIISDYLLKHQNIYYAGCYDIETDKINIFNINFDKMELSSLNNNESNENDDINTMINNLGLKGNELFMLDLDTMNALKDSESLEDVKSFIDEMIEFSRQCREEKEKTIEKLTPEKMSLKKEESIKFNLKELRKEVLENIIGQNETVYDVTRALAINYTSKNPRNKSHILITGPSGTGKTEIINIIAKKLDLPVFKADATDYSKTGYVGKEVKSMLAGLITAADGDIEKAQRGILIIDEIDKKSSDSKDDVSGKAVLHSLLKIMDRDVMEVDMDMYQSVMFDTSNITLVFMGSFDELHREKTEENKLDNKSIGFVSVTSKKEAKKEETRLTEDDLVKWLGPEFVGRLGLITSTNKLSIEKVVEILHSSKISQLKTIKEDLEDRGIKLLYTSGYLKEIAKRGTSEETGVRKLNKVVKENLKYIYDDILINGEPKTLMLTMRTAKNGRIYKKNN